MDRQGVTQAELARRLDRTRGHISQIMAGGRNLTLASIAELGDALGCRVEVKLVKAGHGAKGGRARAAVAAKR